MEKEEATKLAEDFIESQMLLMDNTMKGLSHTVLENAKNFHRSICERPDNDTCEELFVRSFMLDIMDNFKDSLEVRSELHM